VKKTKENLVEQFRSRAQKNPIIALFIILGIIVIAISLPLGALDGIISFYKLHFSSDTKSAHVVLYPKTDSEFCYIPKAGEIPAMPLRFGFTFWNCNDTTFDISTFTVEFSNAKSNSFIQIGSSLADKDGAPVSLPLVFSPNQKDDLIFSFQPIGTLPEDFKIRITAYTHVMRDKLIANLEFKRLTNGWEGSLDYKGKNEEFGLLVWNKGDTNRTVTFLKPFKDTNYAISLQSEPRYKGDWKNGYPEGHGVYTWPDGSKYDGQWKDGKANGYGIRTLVSGESYDGEWRNGQQEGQGVNIWPDGTKYIGQWMDGKCEGSGIMTHTNSEKYDGEWKDGNPQGHGVLTEPDGRTLEGNWQKGSLTVTNKMNQ
jgi:hypothetical protein